MGNPGCKICQKHTQKWDTTSNRHQRYRRAHCGASQIWSNDIRARYFNEFLRFITSRFLKKPLIAHKPKTRSNTEAQTSTGATYTTHNHGQQNQHKISYKPRTCGYTGRLLYTRATARKGLLHTNSVQTH